MTEGRAFPPPDHLIPELREALPVLTEVVVDGHGSEFSLPVAVVPVVVLPEVERPVAVTQPVARDPLDDAMQGIDEDHVAREVLSSLQGQVDRLFEFRVKSALEPVLQGLVTQLVQQAREELSAVMVDVVRRAVSQELARRKTR